MSEDELNDALGTLAWINHQAASAMQISANAAPDLDEALAEINSIASDIAINCEMMGERLKAMVTPEPASAKSLISQGGGE